MSRLPRQDEERLLERMCRFLKHGHSQGICLESIDGEAVTLRLPYREELIGNMDTGAIHSGAITMILDQCLGSTTITSRHVTPHVTPTLDLRVDHLRPSTRGKDIFARAWIDHITSRIIFAEGYAYCDSKEKPIARATGTFVLMPDLELEGLLGGMGESA